MRLSRLWIPVLFALVPQIVFAWGRNDCGKEGQPPCAVSEAKFERAQGWVCPTGQFFDLIQGGTCWSCPDGFNRTIPWGVDTDKACRKGSSTDFRRAHEHGRAGGFFGTSCPDGQFWDIVDGNCHSCAAGYDMQVLEHVHSDRKCGRGIPEAFARATNHGKPCNGNIWDPRNGGECWSCPDGYVRTVAPVTSGYACEYAGLLGATGLRGCEQGLNSIRNVCVKTGVCGKDGQRPCEISERLPSCDEGLREDFNANKCVPLRPGETPFTGGLSSVAQFWGNTLQGRCKQLLGSIDIPGEGKLGVGLRCGKDIAVGFACYVLRDLAAGYTDIANTVMEKAPEGGTLAKQMNAAANKPPCTNYRERFAKATRHAKATGPISTDCPSGQFWDPKDGFCYSCPNEFTRTLYPVDHARACTDRVGGNLLQFGCGAIEGVMASFNEPVKCTVQVLENGNIIEKKVDLKNADQTVCMATGELGYNIIKVGFEAGKAIATGDILSLLAKIGGTAASGLKLQKLMDCRRQALKQASLDDGGDGAAPAPILLQETACTDASFNEPLGDP